MTYILCNRPVIQCKNKEKTYYTKKNTHLSKQSTYFIVIYYVT